MKKKIISKFTISNEMTRKLHSKTHLYSTQSLYEINQPKKKLNEWNHSVYAYTAQGHNLNSQMNSYSNHSNHSSNLIDLENGL